jgi:hypothetical protein
MSTFRYRATNGAIDIAANTLTAVTANISTIGTGALTCTTLSASGAASVTNSLSVLVTGVGALSVPMFVIHNTMPDGGNMLNIFGQDNSLNNNVILTYNHITDGNDLNNFKLQTGGSTALIAGSRYVINVSGQTAGTLVAKPAGIVGSAVGAVGAVTANADVIENVTSPVWAAAANVNSVTLDIGHWIVYWNANPSVSSGGIHSISIVINGVAYRNFAASADVGAHAFMSGAVPVNIKANGIVVMMDILAGATGGASQTLMSAVRIG